MMLSPRCETNMTQASSVSPSWLTAAATARASGSTSPWAIDQALVSGGGAIDSELAKCSSCTVKWLDTISALQWAQKVSTDEHRARHRDLRSWHAAGVDPLGGSFEDGSGLHLEQPGDHHSEPHAA